MGQPGHQGGLCPARNICSGTRNKNSNKNKFNFSKGFAISLRQTKGPNSCTRSPTECPLSAHVYQQTVNIWGNHFPQIIINFHCAICVHSYNLGQLFLKPQSAILKTSHLIKKISAQLHKKVLETVNKQKKICTLSRTSWEISKTRAKVVVLQSI